MNITPDQARELLDGASDGPWEHGDVPGPGEDPIRATEVYQPGEPGAIAYVQPNTADVKLIAAASDLAQTIAGMTEQWRHEAWHDRGDGIGPWRSLCWPHDDGWRNTRESADFDLAQAEGTFKHRLVRRLAGPVEVAE